MVQEPALEGPVSLRFEMEVSAPPERVWQVLGAVREWPRWHPGVTVAVLRGPLRKGVRLDWTADGMRIRSTIDEVSRPRRLGLALRMLGGRGYARWTLEPRAGGSRTFLVAEEAWSGLAVRLLSRTLRRTLEVARARAFEALRERAEETDTE